MLKITRKHIAAALGSLSILLGIPAALRAQSALPDDNMSAVIFVYYRIGDDDDAASAGTGSIRADQFQDHVRELQSGHYTVLPLAQVVAALKSGQSMPANSVALTFDGGHKSIMTQVAPLLLKNRLPFTIFISPSQLDQGLPDYVSWKDVKTLARNGLVTIGLHTADYRHVAASPPTEIARQINSAKARYREQLGRDPLLFAYPFGEYGLRYRNLVATGGFAAAFGQQSGVAWKGSDFMALPRFSMTESYGDIDRFRMAADALPLPVTDIAPKDPQLAAGAWPAIGFTVDPQLKAQLPGLSCFVADQVAPDIHIVGDTRVELRLKQPLAEGKARINCTLPAPPLAGDDTPRWRWLGLMLTAPSS